MVDSTGAARQPPLTNLDAAAGESHGDYGSLVLLLPIGGGAYDTGNDRDALHT